MWEVKCADLSKSPVHRAAIGKDGRGISIRFPRLLRERDDKDPEQATSSDQASPSAFATCHNRPLFLRETTYHMERSRSKYEGFDLCYKTHSEYFARSVEAHRCASHVPGR